MANEKKKKSKGLIALVIILSVLVVGLVLFILNDRGIIRIYDKISIVNKEESKKKEEPKEEPKEETKVSDEAEVLKVDKSSLSKTSSNDIGTITLNNKEYKVKMDYKEEINGTDLWLIYVGDVQLELSDLEYLAVMDDSFLVAKADGSSNKNLYTIKIYDKDLKEINDGTYHYYAYAFEVVSKSGTVTDSVDVKVTNNYKDKILDKNRILVSECASARNTSNHNQDFIQEILKFENGKFTREEVLVVENIFCSPQR